MVAANLRRRGYRQQVRALHILDVWGEAAGEVYPAIAACLAREYSREIDVLVFRCLKAEPLQALQAAGFVVRRFGAPIAWCIDRFALLPTQNWYFVPADGDMLL